MRSVTLACVLGFALATGAVPAMAVSSAEPDTYIFDVLVLQPYKGNFARLVKGKDVPEWVSAISTKGEGTAVPAKTVDMGGLHYRLDHVCKPDDCAHHTLDVLWAPVGQKVWASLVEDGKPPVLLGNPPPPQAKVLADPAAAAAPAQPNSPPAAAVSAQPNSPPSAASAPATTSSPAAPAKVAAGQADEPDTYIFDLLALQPYKGNLARLAKSKNTPEWVKAITAKGEGTAVPAKTLDLGGTSYRLDHVCKPHDCAGNTLDVLWAPGGRKVWAALVAAGKPPVLLGNPPAEVAKALNEAAAASH